MSEFLIWMSLVFNLTTLVCILSASGGIDGLKRDIKKIKRLLRE